MQSRAPRRDDSDRGDGTEVANLLPLAVPL